MVRVRETLRNTATNIELTLSGGTEQVDYSCRLVNLGAVRQKQQQQNKGTKMHQNAPKSRSQADFISISILSLLVTLNPSLIAYSYPHAEPLSCVLSMGVLGLWDVGLTVYET